LAHFQDDPHDIAVVVLDKAVKGITRFRRGTRLDLADQGGSNLLQVRV
jgi:hypothetical protein